MSRRSWCTLVFLGLLVWKPCKGQSSPDTGYSAKIRPFLAKNCLACHNEKLRTANLNLSQPSIDAQVWARVLDKLSSGLMPPPGLPKPDRGDIAAVTAWIEDLLRRNPDTTSSPGRVTARRLNRAEYNNTIRDLLAVPMRPADEFPLDDAGYGFDNNGDVLSVSPLLMEKYMDVARKVSRVAVYGADVPKRPTKLVRFMSKKSQDDPTPGALPYSYRGAIYGSFFFPVAAEYELRMRIGNYRPRGSTSARARELSRKKGLTEAEKAELREENRKAYPPVKMVLTVDKNPLVSTIVEGNIDFDYAHGETVGRLKLTAGEHNFRASFPEFADLVDVRDNVNLDGRRKLFIDYVDIVGPFQPSTEASESRRRIFICSEQTNNCAHEIINNLLRRAYRRPATDAEVADMARLAALVRKSGDSFDEAMRVVVQAVLVSPKFLFRIERDGNGSRAAEISPWDLASRLSYFLWSSMPDKELLAVADARTLRQPSVLNQQIQRMLRDPKSDELVRNFAGQWLGLRLLDRRKPSPATFPEVDDELLDSMRSETELFTRAIIRDDRSVLDFIDGPFSFLNGPLARHYGIPDITGEELRRVGLDPQTRGGVLTQGSVLTLSSYATRTSPVLRGKWVLENLLGTPPPPPPPDIPALEESNLGVTTSLRKRLEQHRANPSCAVCHDQMDAIGFALENYDASGAWRTKDGNLDIDSSGKLPGGIEFNGPAELKQALRKQSPLFVRNLTEKLLTYALGRGVEIQDRSTLETIINALIADDYRFSTLANQIVASPQFQQREGVRMTQEGRTVAHR